MERLTPKFVKFYNDSKAPAVKLVKSITLEDVAELLKTTKVGYEINKEKFARLPICGNLRAKDPFCFIVLSWIEDLRIDPAHACVTSLQVDDVEHAIGPGDWGLVDCCAADAPISDGVYLLEIDKVRTVKRLQRLPGKMIRIISSNQAYAQLEIHEDSPSLRVIGRVVLVTRRI
ncbi:MAG: S24 family peptidase [Chloroflexota bacterium]